MWYVVYERIEQLTYALDGRVLGVELPARGHVRGCRGETGVCRFNDDHWGGIEVSFNICQRVCGVGVWSQSPKMQRRRRRAAVASLVSAAHRTYR
jgi:hypothetical protein